MLISALILACSGPLLCTQGTPTERVDPVTRALDAAGAFDRVLLDSPGDGRLWAVGENWKASFGAEGVTFHPFLGSAAPRTEAIRFDLTGLLLDGEALDIQPSAIVESDPEAVTIDRGAALERYLLRPGEMEQTFVFTSLPRRGEIEVQLDVESSMQVLEAADGSLQFRNESGLGADYSRAFAYDQLGRRTDVVTTRTATGLALRVPAAFVANAVLPLTIDPVIGGGAIATEAYAEYEPDVVYMRDIDRWIVCYHRWFSAVDTDVYVRSVDMAGQVSSPGIIDATADVWSNARVSALRGSGKFLVVASVVPDDPTTEDGVIRGRIVLVPSLSALPSFDISEAGSGNNVQPEIGADNTFSPLPHYLVVWERDYAPTDGDIHGRPVTGDGALVGLTIRIEDTGFDDDRNVTISPSLGASGNEFVLAWERDGANVAARRIDRLGDVAGRPTYIAMFGGRRPSVTSFMDRRIGPFLTAVIAAEIQVQPPTGSPYGSIGLVVVDEGDRSSRRYDVSAMEDVAPSSEQSQPTVVADEAGFVLGYRSPFSSMDDDIFMLSGSVTSSPTGSEPALAERFRLLSTSLDVELRPQFASEWDGGGASGLTFGVWQDGDTIATADIRFGLMELGFDPGSRPVGVQSEVCDTNANTNASTGWIVISGEQSTGGLKTMRCLGLPCCVFGIFVTSQTIGFAPNPGGSQGNLCLGGDIGRFSTIVDSGATGMFEQTLSMATLPTPFGNSATSPGDRWHFQAWHRDTVAGAATSNFSGTTSIVFE